MNFISANLFHQAKVILTLETNIVHIIIIKRMTIAPSPRFGQNQNQNPLTLQVSRKGPVKFRHSQRYIISDFLVTTDVSEVSEPLRETC